MLGSIEDKLADALESGNKDKIKAVFETIYNEYSRLVAFSISKYINDVETVKDLTNEVFVDFFNDAKKVNSNIKSFLCTMARNTAINHAKKQSRMIYTDQEDVIPADDHSSNKSASYYNELIDDLKSILSEREVLIIELHIVEGFQFDEIGEQLGISMTNATVIYHRALKKFRSSSKGRKYEKR